MFTLYCLPTNDGFCHSLLCIPYQKEAIYNVYTLLSYPLIIHVYFIFLNSGIDSHLLVSHSRTARLFFQVEEFLRWLAAARYATLDQHYRQAGPMHMLGVSQATPLFPQGTDHVCGHGSTVPRPVPCESHIGRL